MSVRCWVAMGDSFTAGTEPAVVSFTDGEDLERFEEGFDRVLGSVRAAPGPPRVVTATYPEITASFPLLARTRERGGERAGSR